MTDQLILALADYAVDTGLMPARDKTYAVNQLLHVMGQNDFSPSFPKVQGLQIHEILSGLLDEAVKRGLVEDSVVFKDLFDSQLMNCVMERPSAVQERFEKLYAQNPKAATDWFYNLSLHSNYIRQDRIAKDERWLAESPYGDLEITINLSKPEKDPKAIAAAKKAVQSAYPKCQLCIENEGYYGRVDHPGRANHRIIEIEMNHSPWAFQYSPYVYYNEHCIVFNQKHTPMAINHDTFVKLFDFVEQFPHYMLGSNADLPIVGGSILSHDHFQGGGHEFPMAKAPLRKEFVIPGYEDVKAGIAHWPMSVIRLSHPDKQILISLADHILEKWRGYSDEEADILAFSNGEPHNTITPIVRTENGEYVLELVLRNNRTSQEHPLGIFHPHQQWHHIKKENIGLVEVMGLAVLPSRLKAEMEALKQALLNGDDYRKDPVLEKHADWADAIKNKYEIRQETLDGILEKEIGTVFCHVLEDAGVYKNTKEGQEAFDRFLAVL